MNNLYSPVTNQERKLCFVRLMEQHFGIELTEDEIDQFCDRTAVLNVQPVTGQHIKDRDVNESHAFLKSESEAGKTQIIFIGCDEMLQDFALNKVQTIAEMCARDNLFESYYYLIDDIDGVEIYNQYCIDENRPNLLHIIGGPHYAFHNEVVELGSVNNKTNRPYRFVSYCRMPRPHRVYLIGYLLANNLVSQGLISFMVSDPNLYIVILEEISFLRKPDNKVRFPELLPVLRDNWDSFPWHLDFSQLSNNHEECTIRHDNVVHAEDSYFSIVTETFFFESGAQDTIGYDLTDMGGRLLTEKTFKPLILGQPFVLIGRPGLLSALRGYGFKTFGDFWDESYDLIEDDTERLTAIFKLISELCAKTNAEMDDMMLQMRSVLHHNKQISFSTPLNTTVGITVEEANKLMKG